MGGMVHAGAGVIMVMVVGHIGPLCHDGCRHGQSGGVIIFVPLADTFYGCNDKYAKNQHKRQRKQNLKKGKANADARKSKIRRAKSYHSHFSFLKVVSEWRKRQQRKFLFCNYFIGCLAENTPPVLQKQMG